MESTNEQSKYPEFNNTENMGAGEVFLYRGYEVTIVKRDASDKTPAWSNLDARTGKRIILVVENIPKSLVVPLLEHEVYEIENNLNHKEAIEVGRQKAKELGVLDEFLSFEQEWEQIKTQQP